MGTKKEIRRTGKIDMAVPLELRRPCFQMRANLNILETKLERDFPQVYEETAVAHLDLQEALKNYFNTLSNTIARRIIETSKVIALEDAPVSFSLFSNFVKYLKGFGEVGFSSLAAEKQGIRRCGVFLRKDKDNKFLGLLEAVKSPLQLGYTGYVPTHDPEEKFYGHFVYHLSSPPVIEGINFAYVRLFAQKIDDGFERIDGFGERGIEFP